MLPVAVEKDIIVLDALTLFQAPLAVIALDPAGVRAFLRHRPAPSGTSAPSSRNHP